VVRNIIASIFFITSVSLRNNILYEYISGLALTQRKVIIKIRLKRAMGGANFRHTLKRVVILFQRDISISASW
jgi:hypothetical protein